LKRSKKLEKYIKHYTGKNVKVFIMNWIWGGYGGWYNRKKNILELHKDDADYKPLVWHEMGHLIDKKRGYVNNEVFACTWHLNRLKALGYNRLYKESLEWYKGIGHSGCERDKEYRKVAKIISKKFDNNA